MRKKLISLLFVGLTLLSLLTLSAGTTEALDYEKGHTGIGGKTTQKESNFVFELSAPYWYKNLHLYLDTWKNSSDYKISINGKEIDNGTIYEGKTHVNYTLPTGSAVNLKVQIDNYTYLFEHKLITEKSVEGGWNGPGGKDIEHKMTQSQYIIFTWKTLMWGILGAAVAVATMYPLAKLLDSEKTGRLVP